MTAMVDHVHIHRSLAVQRLRHQEALADLHEVGAHAWIVLPAINEVGWRDGVRVGVVSSRSIRDGAACKGRQLAPEHVPVLEVALADLDLLVRVLLLDVVLGLHVDVTVRIAALGGEGSLLVEELATRADKVHWLLQLDLLPGIER